MDSTKCSCVNFYENDITQFLLGDVFHPGGLELTAKMARELGLNEKDLVLDVACGQGATVNYLVQNFGCRATGVDLSEANLSTARAKAADQGVQDKLSFRAGDAEKLPLEDKSCSIVVSECAFCTFPDKNTAASEMYRIMRPAGRLGLSDMIVDQARLPLEMQTLLFRAACVADARTAGEYREILARSGFNGLRETDCSETLLELTGNIRKRLLMAELAVKLKKIDLGEVDFEQGKKWLNMAEDLIRKQVIGYVMITGYKN